MAAGKVQRWEVTKWAVTANVALAAASAATGEFHVMFFALAVFIAATACLLLWQLQSQNDENQAEPSEYKYLYFGKRH